MARITVFCLNCQGPYWVNEDCICAGCGENICIVCGCTDSEACIDGCEWVRPGVCSNCGDKVKK